MGSETMKEIAITKPKGTLIMKTCTEADLDKMMALQETVCSSIQNQDIFMPSDREDNAAYLEAPNFVIGCFDGETLVAYSSFVLPGEDACNYGWDLGWPLEKILSCAKLDTVVVHPSYRGNHLQQQLIAFALEFARENNDRDHGIKYILTTVSPSNEHSLHNVQEMGFEVLMQKRKYGGKERFILCRTLY